MSTAVRLNDDLVREAESEALLHKRTTPKQLEYWAEIGMRVARSASADALLYLLEDLAEVQVHPRSAQPVDADAIFAELDRQRESGVLADRVAQAPFRYQASREHPGLLERIDPDGRRRSGRFRNGEFVPARG